MLPGRRLHERTWIDCLAPNFAHFGIAMDTKLEHEAFDCAENGDVLEVSDFGQVVKTVGSVRGPSPINLDYEITLGGFKLDAKLLGSLFFGFVRAGQLVLAWRGVAGQCTCHRRICL